MKKIKLVMLMLLIFVLSFSTTVNAYYNSTIVDQNSSTHSTSFSNWLCIDSSSDRRFAQRIDSQYNTTESITTYWETEGTAGNRGAKKFLLYYANLPNETNVPSGARVITLNDTTSPDNTIFSVTHQSALLVGTDNYLIIEVIPINHSFNTNNAFTQNCSDIEYKPRIEIASAGNSYLDNETYILYKTQRVPAYSGTLTAIPDNNGKSDMPFITYASVGEIPENASYISSNATYIGSGGTDGSVDTLAVASANGRLHYMGNNSAIVGQSFNVSHEKIDTIQFIGDVPSGSSAVMHIRASPNGANLFTSVNEITDSTQGATQNGVSTHLQSFYFDTEYMELNLDAEYYIVLEYVQTGGGSGWVFETADGGDDYVYGEGCQGTSGALTCGLDDMWFQVYGDGEGGNLINSFTILPYNQTNASNLLHNVIYNVSDNDAYFFNGLSASPIEIPRLLNTIYASVLRLVGFEPFIFSAFIDGDDTHQAVLTLLPPAPHLTYQNFNTASRLLSEDGWVWGRYDYDLGSGEPEYLDKSRYPLETKVGINKENNKLTVNTSDLIGTNSIEIDKLFAEGDVRDLYNITVTEFTFNHDSVNQSNYNSQPQIAIGLTSLTTIEFTHSNISGDHSLDIYTTIFNGAGIFEITNGSMDVNAQTSMKLRIISDFVLNQTDIYVDLNEDGIYDNWYVGMPFYNTTRASGLSDQNSFEAFGLNIPSPSTNFQTMIQLDNLNITYLGVKPQTQINGSGLYNVNLNVTDTSGNALYGVEVDAQFVITGEDTIKYTDSDGLVTFEFPQEETAWTFVFNLAGFEQEIASFDTDTGTYNVQLTTVTSENTILFIHVKNSSNNIIIENAYVDVGGITNGYTNEFGWVKFFDDSIGGTQSITVTKGGYSTEIDSIYITPASSTNETILMTPTAISTSLNVSVAYNSSGVLVPIDDIAVSIFGNGADDVKITTALGWVLFSDIPSGVYSLRLDDLLEERTFNSIINQTVNVPPSTTTHVSYEMFSNFLPSIINWYTLPPLNNDGEVTIDSYSDVEVHLNITDENIETTKCIIYPLYDTTPSFYIESDYDTEAGELKCSATYTTADINHTVRVYVVDYETYVRSDWINSLNYITFTVNVGDVGDLSILFEEHFDYTDSITNHGWGLFSDVASMTPTNEEFILQGISNTRGRFAYHGLGDYGSSSFYCTWQQTNIGGNSHVILFDTTDLFVESALETKINTYLYTYPFMNNVPVYTDYEYADIRNSEDSLFGYRFPFLEQTDQSKLTSSFTFYPVPAKYTYPSKSPTLEDHSTIGQYQRLQEHQYTILYNPTSKTYNIYQDQQTLVQQFGVQLPTMDNPNAIGFAITGDEDYSVAIDDIVCKLGTPEFISVVPSAHGWRSDGSFDSSVCNAGEQKGICMFRTTISYILGLITSLIFNNIIITILIIIAIILLAPLLLSGMKK